MAEICFGVMGESETSGESSCRATRRRRMELRRVRIDSKVKRRRLEICDNAFETCGTDGKGEAVLEERELQRVSLSPKSRSVLPDSSDFEDGCDSFPKFGIASICGRRRDMEDAVAIHPSFFRREQESDGGLHYFGVYDGHGCSHVAAKCKERLHEIVRGELLADDAGEIKPNNDWWKRVMERSFNRMDSEVVAWNENVVGDATANCRCELQTPECDAVGSTAVVAVVTPREIVVANCGDSRAVLCRNGVAVPLSNDHKPDRPDELRRIQAAGGRVIYWEGARVLGVLAMSRAIGDNYLKPYVSCEPEVTITERSGEDEFLILASDGLWDVVSNNTACGVSRMCLKGVAAGYGNSGGDRSDKACSDASLLLTKLALARGSADNVSVVVIDLRKAGGT